MDILILQKPRLREMIICPEATCLPPKPGISSASPPPHCLFPLWLCRCSCVLGLLRLRGQVVLKGRTYRNEYSRERAEPTQKCRGGTVQTMDNKHKMGTESQWCGGQAWRMEGGQEAS